MKKASEWAKDMGSFRGENCENVSMKDRVEQIQLDAMKDGMRMASELAYKYNCEVFPERLSENGVKREILSVAEQLTEKDL
jgi:hypothetical protein